MADLSQIIMGGQQPNKSNNNQVDLSQILNGAPERTGVDLSNILNQSSMSATSTHNLYGYEEDTLSDKVAFATRLGVTDIYRGVKQLFSIDLFLIPISDPTRLRRSSYAVFCLKNKNLTIT